MTNLKVLPVVSFVQNKVEFGKSGVFCGNEGLFCFLRSYGDNKTRRACINLHSKHQNS